MELHFYLTITLVNTLNPEREITTEIVSNSFKVTVVDCILTDAYLETQFDNPIEHFWLTDQKFYFPTVL